jgi:ribonuclease HI
MSDQSDNDRWVRMSFKGNKVWAQTDARGNLLNEKGTIRIKYNLKQEYEYRVKPDSLKPEDQAVPAKKKSKSRGASKTAKKLDASGQSTAGMDFAETDPATMDLPENCIRIYTDGASSGNPGPSGIGILFIYGDSKREISKSIGTATNNIAELTAIKVALEELKRMDLPVCIFTDSSYAVGLLTQNWKPKKNQDLVVEIRALMGKFSDLRFQKVAGHSGIKENEVADYLATSAIKKGPI